jgi:hypothetical protein
MKRLFMVVALIGAMVEPALACHRYHVWHYPWPQRCPVALDSHGTPVAEALTPRPLPPKTLPALAPPVKPDPAAPAPTVQPSADKDSEKVNDVPVNPLD